MLTIPPKLKQRRECKKRQKDIMNGLLNNYDTETVVSDNSTIDDCIQIPIRNFKICGKEINQEVGDNNEFDENEITENMAGNGGGTVDNFAHSEVSNVTGFMKILAGKDYFLEYEYDELLNTNSRQIYFYNFEKEFIKSAKTHSYSPINKKTKIVADEDGYVKITYDRNVRNIKFYEEEYISYPSSKKESKIEYIEGNQEVIHTNKNLFKLGEYIEGYTQIDSGSFHLSVLGESYLFETSKLPNNITISAVNANRSNISYYDEFPKEGVQAKEYSNKNSMVIPRTVEINKNYKYILIQLSYQQEISDIQIEKGINQTDYVESKIDNYLLTNLPAMYSEKDCIVKLTKAEAEELGLDGAGDYVYNEWEKYIVTGDEEYSKSNNIFTMLKDISLKEYSTSQIPDFKSNMFVPIINNTIYSTSINLALSTYIVTTAYNFQKIVFKNTETSTIEEFKNWIKKLYICIIYPLKVPKYTKITDEILIEQLEELRKMVSFEGTNHFIITAENGQAMNLEVTVYKNSIKIMQKEIDNIKALVLES